MKMTQIIKQKQTKLKVMNQNKIKKKNKKRKKKRKRNSHLKKEQRNSELKVNRCIIILLANLRKKKKIQINRQILQRKNKFQNDEKIMK